MSSSSCFPGLRQQSHRCSFMAITECVFFACTKSSLCLFLAKFPQDCEEKSKHHFLCPQLHCLDWKPTLDKLATFLSFVLFQFCISVCNLSQLLWHCSEPMWHTWVLATSVTSPMRNRNFEGNKGSGSSSHLIHFRNDRPSTLTLFLRRIKKDRTKNNKKVFLCYLPFPTVQTLFY